MRNEVLLPGWEWGRNLGGCLVQGNGRQRSFQPFDEVLDAVVDAAAELWLARQGTNAMRHQEHRRAQTGWPVDSTATYGQEVEPPVNRKSPGHGVPAGLGRSPDAAGDADVIEMGGHRTRWPWAGPRALTISIALAALVAGLVLGFIGGPPPAHPNRRPAPAPPAPPPRLPVGGTPLPATAGPRA